MELGICPKIDLMCISSNLSRLRSYRQVIKPHNRIRKPRITAKIWIDVSKNMYETDDKNQIKHQFKFIQYFTEQVVGVFKKPPYKSN
jgi:hypothetical protein